MISVPVIPESAPFTAEQRAWLNGYLAGLFSRGSVDGVADHGPASSGPATALTPLTILFGSQTGTAEGLAKRMAKEAGKRGFAAIVMDMAQVDLTKLAGEKNLLLVTSTYGEGEPPDNAKALHTALAMATARSLSNVRFSVCALGDTNYSQFCKCGRDFDAFLEKLGGTRITPRADCDLEFEERFSGWLDAALTAFVPDGASFAAAHTRSASAATEAVAGYSKQNPFFAPVLAVRGLNGSGSAKEVNHVEISLEGSGLVYEAGDALGVMPQNCPEAVADVLAVLGCDGEEAVAAPDGSTTSLRHALTVHYDLGKPTTALLEHYGAAGQGGGVTVALHHVIDVLHGRVDVRLAPADFVRRLRKLQPRLYSISSSPKAHPGQVHLTVGAVRYELGGRVRKGVCSTFLAERALALEQVGVFVHANQSFRVPMDGSVPVIMVGPGTGIAPFRAFLEERRVTGATGKNWLFFGDQRESADFLYRDELLALRSEGILTHLDLAWSRDQPTKIYVQNRMLENAVELFAWLEAGAHLYVCGDATRMAKDVDAILHKIIERAGGKSADQAAAYVQELKVTKRYARDVY